MISNKTKKQETPALIYLDGLELPKTSEVVDLGVNFNSKLNFSDHISSTIAKAKQRLFLLRKICLSRNPAILIIGFKTYVLPILEYCSPVWNNTHIIDINRLESIQRMFTKKLTGYQGLNYPLRLEKTNLCTLELRRLRADLCYCYKILHGHIDTDSQKMFEIDNNSNTRGYKWKLKTSIPRLDSRLHFFSCRVINPWNSLSQATVEASSVGTFRALLELESLDKF